MSTNVASLPTQTTQPADGKNDTRAWLAHASLCLLPPAMEVTRNVSSENLVANSPILHTRRWRSGKAKKRKRKRSSLTMWNGANTPTPKTKRIKGRRHEKQKDALCGVHAVNNAMGKKILERSDVDHEVESLHRNKPNGPIHGTKKGDYTIVAILQACQKKGYSLRKLGGKSHMWLGTQKCGKFIVMGCHRKYDENKFHYVAVDADEGVIIDSARKGMLQLNWYGVLGVLSCGIYKLYRIEKI